MPNTAKTHSGKTLRQRAAIARRLTAEQQRTVRESQPTARQPRVKAAASAQRTSRTSSERPAKAQKADKRGGSVTKRSAKNTQGLKKPAKQQGRFSLPSVSGKLKVAAVVVVTIVVCIALLYPAGKTYYQTMRQEQRLQAQLDAVNAYKDGVESANEDLNTDEGVTDQARQNNMVEEGESLAIVTNTGEDSGTVDSGLPDKVDEDSIHAPETWYYTILDAFFGVSA